MKVIAYLMIGIVTVIDANELRKCCGSLKKFISKIQKNSEKGTKYELK